MNFHEPHTAHHHRHHHPEDESPSPVLGDGTTIPARSERGRGRGRGHRSGGSRGRSEFAGPGSGPGRGSSALGSSEFGPGRRRRRPKGAVREAVLSLLAEEPANGYSLMRQIAERTDGTWSPSPGSMYPTLSQLVDEGLIEATGSGQGTLFVLTEEGRAHVSQNAEAIEAMWADGSRGAPSHASMRESMRALIGVAQQYRFATDEQRNLAAEQLDSARRALHRILAE